MTYWDILGIEPVDDPSTVKKAYAKKLKLHHPEDDPEGYQRLREAYDAIRKQLKKGLSRIPEKQQAAPAQTEQAPVMTAILEPEKAGGREDSEETVNAFISKVLELYRDVPQRLQLDSWINLLNEPALWDWSFKKKAGTQLFVFLKEHPLLPKDVWLLLEESFQWRESIPEYMLDNDPDLFRFWTSYQKYFGPYPSFSFEEIARQEGVDADAFLQKREYALDAFLAGRLTEARLAAEEAFSLFSEDPDLLRLHGEIYIQLGEYEQGALLYEQYLKSRPEDKEAVLALARTEYARGNWKKTASLCEELTNFSQHPGVLSLQAKCQLKEKEAEKTLCIWKDIQKKCSYDAESFVYLTKLHAYIRDHRLKLKRTPGLPARRETKAALMKTSPAARAGLFCRFVFEGFNSFLAILMIVSWIGVLKTAYGSNPFEFMLLIIGSLLFPNVSLSFIDSKAPFIWLALFSWGFYYLARSIFRALRAVRY
ncbi:tetratricopeptide repeat protein [Domibacillus indicus]|uniref:tetratricopeptide repeat protein n=1 Tax=Domibacillus indicus TaxID=1437523 RepID=UPI000617D225|nr:tetratricopeptide repeat protein [Domibacillus indicus]